MEVLGKRVPRLDASDKVTGRTVFAADINLPGMLHCKFLLSPYAHARIKRIDVSRAEALPKVVAVVTAKDVPDTRYGEMIHDQQVFAREKVRYAGDVVAAVAAEDLETAERAVKLIDVEYEPLPPLLSSEEALREDAPLIHEDYDNYSTIPPIAQDFVAVKGLGKRNLCWQTDIQKGDVEKGFAEADHVIEETFTTEMGQGCPIEPRAWVADVDSTGKVTIWSSTQVPFPAREQVAHALQIPISKVRVIAPPIGGGFGAKCQVGFEPQIAAVARKAGRPVKLVLTRDEELITANPRHPSKIRIKSGVKNDGTITAREAEVYLDTGYCTYLAPLATSFSSFLACGPYKIPNFKASAAAVFTNKPSCSMVRAPTAPQTAFAVESHMDTLAKAVGMDPLEFRMKNAVEDGDYGPTNQVYKGVGLKETIRKVAERINWSAPREKGRGVGLACSIWLTALGYGSGATVQINEDGTVCLNTGAVDHGTGSTFAALAMIVSEELGIPMEKISIVNADTDTTPWDFGGVGSRTTLNAGHAVRMAARDAKRKLMQMAANMLEANIDDLDMKEGSVFVKGSPEKAVPVAMLCAIAPYALFGGPGAIIGCGAFNTVNPPFDPSTVQRSVQPSFGAPSFATQAAEIEVDEETGDIKVHRIVAAADIGFAVNPLGLEGQLEGGITMGLGLALTEQTLFDKEGRMLNPTFLDFKVPLAIDTPQIESIVVESTAQEGLEGIRGAGELPIIATPAAIANALANVTGKRAYQLPLTPERVLNTLRERQETQ